MGIRNPKKTDDFWSAVVLAHYEALAAQERLQKALTRLDVYLDQTRSEVEHLQKTQIPSVNDLAQIIRVVDGKHSLGAGALAEGIIAKIREAKG